jgi:isopenicillin-N N-acyltransferase like protein
MMRLQFPPPKMAAFLFVLAVALLCSSGCMTTQPAMSEDGVVQRWLVARPIPFSGKDRQTPDDASQKQAFARDWLLPSGGEASILPTAGMRLSAEASPPLKWQPLQTKNGLLDLQTPGHPTEYAIAYAFVEFDEAEHRRGFLGIGSDDAVKVWLNGKLVHENWTGRGVRLDDDLVPVELQPGKNRLLFKVQNGVGPWGLACRVMGEDEGRAIQAYNQYIHAVAEGDVTAIRAFCHTTTDEQRQRVEAGSLFWESMARLRKAFDEAYGPGRLRQLGFGCIRPDLKLPARPNFKMDGDRASLSPPQWWKIALIKVDNEWKEFVRPWPEAVAIAAAHGVNLLPLEKQTANTQAMNRIMDAVTADVRAGRCLSAADAFGILNARLHGLAGDMAPSLIAATVELTAPASQPASCPVPIIELRGDGAAMGKAYGSQMRDTIRLLDRDYLDRALNSIGSLLYASLTREVVLARAAKFQPLLRPEHLEELRALSATAGFDLRKALLANSMADLIGGEGCSTITLPASASTDGVARFGRNMDYVSLGVLDGHSILLIAHPKDRYAFASVTWPGLVGVMTGMNEHGLSLGCMSVVSSPYRKPDAMPNALLYRCVLEHCRTVDEAIAFLEKTPRQTVHTLMLMDASGDRVVTELTPEKVTVRRAPETAALVSTNHHRGTDLDTPGHCKRFDYLHDAARRQFGQLSEPTIEELLTGAAQGDSTLQSVVFEPANRVLYLAAGTGAPNHGFARIDLKPYFRRDYAE